MPTASLKMADLRPHLKALNWQLRRINVCVTVVAEVPTDDVHFEHGYQTPANTDDAPVKTVRIDEAHTWSIECSRGHKYSVTTEEAICPECGEREDA